LAYFSDYGLSLQIEENLTPDSEYIGYLKIIPNQTYSSFIVSWLKLESNNNSGINIRFEHDINFKKSRKVIVNIDKYCEKNIYMLNISTHMCILNCIRFNKTKLSKPLMISPNSPPKVIREVIYPQLAFFYATDPENDSIEFKVEDSDDRINWSPRGPWEKLDISKKIKVQRNGRDYIRVSVRDELHDPQKDDWNDSSAIAYVPLIQGPDDTRSSGQSPSQPPSGQSPSQSPSGQSPSQPPSGQSPSQPPSGQSPSQPPSGQSTWGNFIRTLPHM